MTEKLDYKVIAMLMLWALVGNLWGCAGEETTEPTGGSGSTTTCDAGDWRPEGGECQPAGLPADMPCPPGEVPLEGGGCQLAGLPADMPCPPGELPLEGGGCQPAGLPADMPCPPGELPLEGGGCQPAGVPPAECAEGFVPDGKRGCLAVLPAQPCPPGQMAVPGETQCHEVAPCGAGPWGDIPVEATTQFVDGSYLGANSDGTQAKPWKTIQQGINNATNGAIVAVAAGLYNEDVRIQGKPVRLWGKCPSGPERAEVVGVAGGHEGTIEILTAAANGSEVRGLGITGDGFGIAIWSSLDVVIDHVWVHDTTDLGTVIRNDLGPTRAAIKASLLESAHGGAGVLVVGSEATIEGTVVRSIPPDNNGEFGLGIIILDAPQVEVRSSLIEDNHEVGIAVGNSGATIEATVVRATHTNGNGTAGWGIDIQNESQVQLRTSLIENNHEVGMAVVASVVAIERTVVRATHTNGNEEFGWGAMIRDKSQVQLHSSLIENNHEMGIAVMSSEATVEATVVRDTLPAGDGTFGAGIQIQEGSHMQLRTSRVEDNHVIGIAVMNSEATVEATVVRATLPAGDGTLGMGIQIQDKSQVQLQESLVEDNRDTGVLVADSEVTIEAAVVRATLSDANGKNGHGIHIQGNSVTGEPSRVQLRSSLVEENHGVGVFVVKSVATVEATVVQATLPDGNGNNGWGISIEEDSQVQLRSSLLQKNHELGVNVLRSDVGVEATVVRDTLPSGNGFNGMGIQIGDQSHVQLRSSRVEANRDAGVLVDHSDVTIEATVVRATFTEGNGTSGRGITIQEESQLHLQSSLVEDNHEVGVLVFNSAATIGATLIRATQMNAQEVGGDGIAVVSVPSHEAGVTLQGVRIEDNDRAGVSFFSAHVALYSSVLACNGLDLNGEDSIEGMPKSFDDGGNLCGCEPEGGYVSTSCLLSSAGLTPPSQVNPVKQPPL